MRITLDTVRRTLRQGLGWESFIAGFIREIHEDNSCPTAAISADGRLSYNPAFTDQFTSSEEDLFCLVLHEVMHPLFGHFVYGSGEIENVAADMVINASISLLFAKPSGDGSLFRKFYERRGLEGLLRPASQMRHNRLEGLYNAFYGHNWGSSGPYSTGEVIHTLKVLTTPAEFDGIMLLGSHGHGVHKASAQRPARIPADDLSRMVENLRRAADLEGVQQAGYGEHLYDLFLDILKSRLSLRRSLLQTMVTRRKMDDFRYFKQRPRVTVSPIPLSPSRRDLLLLAADIPVFHYHNRLDAPTPDKGGLAVYLDVSGSVLEELPHIVSLLRPLRREIRSLFLFSNKVEEVPFETLMEGHIATTYGTDFDCVATSILEHDLDKALILTDGYASLRPELQKALHERGIRTLTVLCGGKMECPEWAPLGDVVHLEDVVE